jgi:hypothetical protein
MGKSIERIPKDWKSGIASRPGRILANDIAPFTSQTAESG